MFDTVDPICMFAKDAVKCPTCKVRFIPKRSNQKYCAASCQKNATRGTRRREAKARNELHFRRALDLAELVYTAPTAQRLGIMKTILEAAREHDAVLRNILTRPALLRATPKDRHLFHRRSPGSYRTISQAADAYCRKFFGLSVKDYLRDGFEGEHEVTKKVHLGSVPRLKPKVMAKAKCWHCYPRRSDTASQREGIISNNISSSFLKSVSVTPHPFRDQRKTVPPSP